jgi:hypothetical protein
VSCPRVDEEEESDIVEECGEDADDAFGGDCERDARLEDQEDGDLDEEIDFVDDGDGQVR